MKLKDRYKRFSTLNKVAFWGSIASIASLVGSAIIALLVSLATDDPSRRLVYYSNPVRTVVFKEGEVSDIEIRYRDQVVRGDVAIAQIALWNLGSIPIRADDLLEEVRVTLTPPVRILEATISQVTRKLTGAHVGLPEQDPTSSTIPVSWKILETNDAILIQVTYSGTTDVTLGVEGALIGQSTIPRFDPWFVQVNKTVNQPVVSSFFAALLFSFGLCLVIGICVAVAKGVLSDENGRWIVIVLGLGILIVGTALCANGVQIVWTVLELPNLQFWPLPPGAPPDWME